MIPKNNKHVLVLAEKEAESIVKALSEHDFIDPINHRKIPANWQYSVRISDLSKYSLFSHKIIYRMYNLKEPLDVKVVYMEEQPNIDKVKLYYSTHNTYFPFQQSSSAYFMEIKYQNERLINSGYAANMLFNYIGYLKQWKGYPENEYYIPAEQHKKEKKMWEKEEHNDADEFLRRCQELKNTNEKREPLTKGILRIIKK
jgi:hypothetical protein